MAPGLIDPQPNPVEAPLAKKPLIGPKEGFDGGRLSYNKDAEEKGTKTQPPATHPKYLPIWDETIT